LREAVSYYARLKIEYPSVFKGMVTNIATPDSAVQYVSKKQEGEIKVVVRWR